MAGAPDTSSCMPTSAWLAWSGCTPTSLMLCSTSMAPSTSRRSCGAWGAGGESGSECAASRGGCALTAGDELAGRGRHPGQARVHPRPNDCPPPTHPSTTPTHLERLQQRVGISQAEGGGRAPCARPRRGRRRRGRGSRRARVAGAGAQGGGGRVGGRAGQGRAEAAELAQRSLHAPRLAAACRRRGRRQLEGAGVGGGAGGGRRLGTHHL